MPSLTGLEVLSTLKTDDSTRHIPVIIISAEHNLMELAQAHGASAVLNKPIDIHMLTGLIHKLALHN